MISIREASAQANKSESTIRNWIKSGKIRAQKQAGRWLVDERSLVGYLGKGSGQVRATTTQQLELSEKQMNDLVQRVVVAVKDTMGQMLEEALIKTTPQPEKKREREEKRIEKLEENERLQKQIAMLELKTEVLEKRLWELQEEVQQGAIQKPAEPRQNYQHAEQAEAQPKRGNNKLRDVARAERWVRENPGKWLDKACGLDLAPTSTWRELAEGEGRIMIGDRLQSSRAYLHIIEKRKGDSWHKVKAIAALEMVQKKMAYTSHYAAEVGG